MPTIKPTTPDKMRQIKFGIVRTGLRRLFNGEFDSGFVKALGKRKNRKKYLVRPSKRNNIA